MLLHHAKPRALVYGKRTDNGIKYTGLIWRHKRRRRQVTKKVTSLQHPLTDSCRMRVSVLITAPNVLFPKIVEELFELVLLSGVPLDYELFKVVSFIALLLYELALSRY